MALAPEKMSPDFEANLTFITTEEGGRRTPALSGYRPQTEFTHIRGLVTSGSQTYLDHEAANPGETVRAAVRTFASDYLVGMLRTGDHFTISEGARLIGTGIIMKFLREDLDFDNVPAGIITAQVLDQYTPNAASETVGLSTPRGCLDHLSKCFKLAERLHGRADYLLALETLIARLSDSHTTEAQVMRTIR